MLSIRLAQKQLWRIGFPRAAASGFRRKNPKVTTSLLPLEQFKQLCSHTRQTSSSHPGGMLWLQFYLEHFKYKCSRMLFGFGERDRLGRIRRRLADETFYGYIFI
jgi:hypothetical protein